MDISDEAPVSDVKPEVFFRRLLDMRMRLGIHFPKIEVGFEDLSVEADVWVGERLLPTLLNATINSLQELLSLIKLSPTKKRQIKILNGVKGVIKPSRMTLILGPPGSGKSTFLRALYGKLDQNLKVTGRVTYNGREIDNNSQRKCAYVSQHDLHHAEMTVRETLDFSGRMLRAGNSHELPRGVFRRDKEGSTKEEMDIEAFTEDTSCTKERKFVTGYILKILGLDECADIIIGDEMRRGISGGQKKRVTIGEMLVGLARGFFMDEISTGLDSTTTFEIVKFLQKMTHFMELTMAISLLQPPPETYELFDDIILLCEGQIIYHGPRERILEFFEYMGFKCPKRKNTADFLQEVTSKMDQAQYWMGPQSNYQYIPVQMFADSFHPFYVGRNLENELQKPCDQTGESPPVRLEDRNDISKWKLFKACFSREVLLMKSNSQVHVFKVIQIGILAIVIMTVFLHTESDHHSIVDGNRLMGAIFAGVVIVNFNGMTELSMTMRRLPVYYKQKELLLLPGWAFLSSIFILSLPFSFFETGIWTCLTYYVIGFAPSMVRFLRQFLAFFCINQMSMSLFRFIAILGRTQVIANMLGSATLIAFYILGGFVISRDDIQPWLAWSSWVSPVAYGQNALAINEYLDERWNKKINYGQNNQDTVGKVILRSRGMFTEWHWFWNCVGALLGFTLLFNILSILSLEYLKAPHEHQCSMQFSTTDVKKRAKAEMQTIGATPNCGMMILPFQPVTLAFSHINYYVDMPKKQKKHGVDENRLQLLQDISGAFRPGVLTALMGVTGAGKTTLLDVLAGRKTGGYTQGSVSISGYPKKQETFARVSGYCEQTDIHSPYVTVYESLQYSAWLRLPSEVDMHKRHMFIEEIVNLVELGPMKNAMVGIPAVHGLSAEQRKRLTIAVELVSSPSIIFMDEPTTLLDARSAAIVMRTVRKTADTGRTVVCTIHQPSIEIFEAFDELLLMKKGGKLIYAGPLGTLSRKMIQYFEAIPGVPKVRDGQNPAAWMLNVSSSVMEFKLGVNYAECFRNSSMYKDNMELVDKLSKAQSNSEDLYFPTKYAKSFESQCFACLWKQHRSYWKNPEHNIVRFIVTIAIALLFGTVFMDIGTKITKEQDVFNILGAMHGSALFVGFANATIVQPVVAMERTVFYRERSAGMYSSMAYAIAQVAIEIPYIIIQVLIFALIVYPMIGFEFELAKFFWFTLFMTFSFIYFALFGMMTVTLTPTIDVAAIFSFFLFLLWNIFSGFFIPRTMIPIWWRWYYWADPAAWTVYGLMVSQLGDRVDVIHVVGRSDQTVKAFLKDYFGLLDSHIALIVALHVGVIIIFLFVFGFSIKYLNFQRR